MAHESPALLDVVPWTYGYAHSWALAWLARNDDSRDEVMPLLDPEGTPPWRLTSEVRREHPVPGARADLVVWAVDAAGQSAAVAIEIKVADRINVDQLDCYATAGFAPVLYVPGLSGMLYAPNSPYSSERWITGRELAAALDGVELPWIVGSYVGAVAQEAKRMDDARAFARGELDDFAYDGRAPYEDVTDAAWIVETVAALRAAGAEDIVVRTERNDRGLYWAGSWGELRDSNGAGLYLDVLADLRTHNCAVALKVMGGDETGRIRCYEAAIAAGPPSAAQWIRGRRPSRNSGRVWSLNANEMAAAEAAQHTLDADAFIRSITDD